ncbi:MAG: PEP-CTERM sorting domain-containing protein [Armatimonadota bacterium]
MKRMATATAAIVAGLAVLLASLPASAERTPPGSFLRDRVDSAQALSAQVKSVNYVGQRYANFYGLKADEVARRFAALEYRHLQNDLRTRVWFVGKGNRILSEVRTFKAGTPMFFTKTGQPVLDGRCGNPLRADLPQAVAQQPAPQTTSVPEAQVAAQGGSGEAAEVALTEALPVQPEPVITQVLAQPAEIIVPPSEVLITETVVPTVTEAMVAPAVESIPAAAAAGGSSLGPLGLLAIPVIAIAAGGGGNSYVIPEPGSLIALGSGLIAFSGVLLRARRG